VKKFWLYIPRVLPFLKPYWALAILSGVLVVIGTLIGLLSPWPMAFLVDNVLGTEAWPPALAWIGNVVPNRFALLVVLVVAYLLLRVFEHGMTVVDNYVNTKLELNMILDFRSDMFKHVQRLSMAHFDGKKSGMLVYAINFQADAAARLLMAIPGMLHSVLTLVGMFVICYRMDAELALLSLFVVPILYVSVTYYVNHIQERLVEARSMEGETLSIIHEAISMFRVILAFGRENHEYRRFREQGQRAVGARVKVTVRQTLFSLVVDTSTSLGTALVLGYGAYHVLEGHLTLGRLLAILSYVAAVYTPLESISSEIGRLQETLAALTIAFKVRDTVPDIQDKPDALELKKRVAGHLVFDKVDFNYKGRVNTLKNISFEAEAGQVIAIVGPTGAGKTTLISLLPRFYDVKAGRILLDGNDLRDLTLRSLRDQLSIVLQEPLLFSGSIANNIRYGRLDATMDDIMEAAKNANAHDFIMKLPQQYDTELGERGVKLSGGERQRISVARAFLRDAPILILDEPTSSIDSKTEAVILDALDRLMVGRTTLMIAHRLSTIRQAHKIIVLDHGRLVEQGSHEELIANEGLYKQLHDLQTKAMRRNRPPAPDRGDAA
jgi:ABC-type multidrug transport system fused ATPase/permease subunit